MSLETTKSLETYDGNGVTTVFPFPFKVWDAAHVKVYANSTGDQVDVTESVTVTLTDGGAAGGTVTFADPPAQGTRIAIARKMPFIQEDRYVSGTRIDPHELEDRLDQDCAERQELRDAIDRCVKTSETSYQTIDDLMNAVEENAVLVEQTKDECLAALEEIREANYAPLSTVEAMADTLSGVSEVADAANTAAGTNTAAIEGINDTLEDLGAAVEQAAADASAARQLAEAGIRVMGSVASTDDLPDDAEAGDIYFVEGTGYIWDGTDWVEYSVLAVDQTIIASSTNPVAGGAVKTALDAKADDSAVMKLSGAQNVTANKTWTGANQGPHVTNTGGTMTLSLRCSDTPRGGLYDSTPGVGDWLIRKNGDGSFTLTSKAANGTAKSLQGSQGSNGGLTWGGADITGDMKKASYPVNVKDYGAVGDGSTDDTLAIQSALATGRDVYIPKGVYVVKDELTLVTQGQKIFGDGRGFGRPHRTNPIVKPEFDWVDRTTLLFKDPSNAGVRYVKTRYKINYNSGTNTQWYNDSSRTEKAYPAADPAMSAGINVQAEGVVISDLCVRLWVNPSEKNNTTINTSASMGADWDIGIFVGTRLEFTLLRVACIGYFRKANIWIDVTHGVAYPRFKDYRTNTAFPNTLSQSGGDGTLLEDVMTHGGLWGVRVQGGEPKNSSSLSTSSRPPLRIKNADGQWRAYTDMRGSYGFSDFTMLNCEIWGGTHHSGKRFVAFPYNSTSAAKTALSADISVLELGGAFMISGIAANTSYRLQGHRYIGTRFVSYAPFTALVNYSTRDTFIGSHGESLAFYDASGNEQGTTNANSFGVLCLTANHTRFRNIASQLVRYDTYYDYKHGDLAIGQESATAMQLTGGTMRVSLENPSGDGQSFWMDYTAANQLSWYPEDAAQYLQFMFNRYIFYNAQNGTDIFHLYNSGVLKLHNDLYSDNSSATLGTSSHKWANVYAATSSIGSSDERLKDDIADPDEALMRAWGKVNYKVFRFKEAIEKKGADARLHVGVIAQQVEQAFASEGLDARRYGLLCYDEWPNEYEEREVIDVPAVRNEDGDVIEPARTHTERRLVKAAGNEYGMRYEEALALECAYQRWRLDRLEAALNR